MAEDSDEDVAAEEPATKKVAKTAGGFFSRLLAAPGGILKGIWGATVGNLGGLLMTTGAVVGLVEFAPSMVDYLGGKVKLGKDGKSVAQIFGEDHAIGLPKVITHAGIAALLINGTLGAGKGALDGVMSSVDGKDNMISKAGGVIGSAVTIAGLACLAFKVVESNKIALAGHADASPKTPTPIPPNPANQGAGAHK